MKKMLKNLILGIFIPAILLLQTSCGTTRVEYVSLVAAEDIPNFPELNYYHESPDGEFITVDSFWFQNVAKVKVRIEAVKEILKRNEELLKESK